MLTPGGGGSSSLSLSVHFGQWKLQWFMLQLHEVMGFPGGSDGKESACSAGEPGSTPGSGRIPGEGNGNPLQYFFLENPMDWGAWWAIVHGVAKSRTWLRSFHFTLHKVICIKCLATVYVPQGLQMFVCFKNPFQTQLWTNHICVCVCVLYMCVCMCSYMYVYICICLCMCICMCTYVCVCLCVYIAIVFMN